jgi:hypothetical protein
MTKKATPKKERTMTRPATISLAAALAAVASLALGAGVAGASTATTAKVQTVKIVMADPGCHWFSVAGKNKASMSVKGATAFMNLDEAALIFKGKGFSKQLPVGKTLTITKAGKYTITMVGQHPDDTHLKLVVS